MTEIRKVKLVAMIDGSYVDIADAEITVKDGIVDKVVSVTPLEKQPSRVTRTNPNGSERQCDRRDIHDPHEWQADFGSYFNVYCPGNDGTKR